MSKYFGFLIAFLFSFLSVKAQLKEDDSGLLKRDAYFVSVSPAHVFLGCLKLEINKPVLPKLMVYAAPEYYNAELFNDSGRVHGFGLHSGVKLGLASKRKSDTYHWTYFQFGLEFNHFSLNSIGNVWNPKIINGNPVLVYEVDEIKTKVNRIGAHMLIGAMTYDDSRFFYEVSCGAAFRKSFFTFDKANSDINRHDQKPWKYGWSGITPLVYFKLGVLLG